MPTKKKRVGFIPRDDVMKIIDKLSLENNLSNSKIISILVEEALSTRGIFNKKNGKETQSSQISNDHSENLFHNSAEYINNTKISIDNKLENHKNCSKVNYLKEGVNESFDLQTYKKFLQFLNFLEMMDKHNNY